MQGEERIEKRGGKNTETFDESFFGSHEESNGSGKVVKGAIVSSNSNFNESFSKK